MSYGTYASLLDGRTAQEITAYLAQSDQSLSSFSKVRNNSNRSLIYTILFVVRKLMD